MATDAELVQGAAAGDAVAWAELVHRYSQLVYANARAVGADRAMSEDTSQLVWMRLVSRLDQIRDPSSIKGWLAIVARNTARSELRRQRAHDPLDDIVKSLVSTAPTPPEIIETRRQAAMVRETLNKLSDTCRELLTLLFSADMSYQEIHEATGRPIGSIGPTRQRCLASMRNLMEGAHP